MKKERPGVNSIKKQSDPGLMMPELGKKLVHQEGVDLIRKWIAEMEY